MRLVLKTGRHKLGCILFLPNSSKGDWEEAVLCVFFVNFFPVFSSTFMHPVFAPADINVKYVSTKTRSILFNKFYFSNFNVSRIKT